jgi:uncharacterized protein YjdB
MKHFQLTLMAIFLSIAAFGAISPSAPKVCIGQTTTLSSNTTGSTWTSSNTAIATVDASGVVTGVAAGSTQINYGASAVTVTVSSSIPPPITGATEFCVGTTEVVHESTSSGSPVWQTSNAAVATIAGSGAVTGISAGTATITFLQTTTGCYATRQVTVYPAIASITGPSTICRSLSGSLSNTSPGGTWSSSNATIVAVDASGVVTGSATTNGTATISYTLTSNCRTTKLITVNLSDANILPSTLVKLCVGQTTSLSGATAGGTWSSANTAIGSIDASGVLTAVSSGSAVYTSPATNTSVTIKYEKGGSCSTTKTINIFPLPGAPQGSANVCVGGAIVLSPPAGAVGSVWSSSNSAIASVGSNASSGNVYGISAGTATITFTADLNHNYCISTTVAVVGLDVDISGITDICLGNQTTLSGAPGGGTWSSGNTAVATASGGTAYCLVTGVGVGTSTITYSKSSSYYNQCRAYAVVTVNPLPSSITGPSTICIGSSAGYSSTPPGGTWSSSNSAIASVVAATGVATGVSAGTATLTYMVGTGCFRTKSITVNAAVIIAGSSEVCEGDDITLGGSPSGGTWNSTNTAVATVSGSGIVSGIASGTATISYIVSSGCYAAVDVTVNPLPYAGVITGPSSVCLTTTISLSDAAPGGTWSSSNTDIATVDAGGVVSPVSAGTVTISYTVTNSCGSESATKTITVGDCCLTNLLVINTGYDPETNTAITGGGNGGAAVIDPHWILTDLSSDASAAISALSYTAVATGQPADVVNGGSLAPIWASYSLSQWISSQNATGYATNGSTGVYTMAVSRSFTLCADDDISLDLQIANDNYIEYADIDGTVFYAQTPDNTYDYISYFLPATYSAHLAAGTHTINFKVVNYTVALSYNPVGLNLYGTVSAANNSLVAETEACAAYSCSGPSERHSNQPVPHAAKTGSLSLFPNPNKGIFYLEGTLGNSKNAVEVKIEVMDMMGKIVYTDVAPAENGIIHKTIVLGDHIANGIYIIKARTDHSSQVLRFNLER